MRLLKKITGFESVDVSVPTHTKGSAQAYGSRIPLHIEEGDVRIVLAMHTFTTTCDGATAPTLTGYNVPDLTTTTANVGYSEVISIGKAILPSAAYTAAAKDFAPRASGNVSFHTFWSCTQDEGPGNMMFLLPYLALEIVIDAASSAGVWTTDIFLFGEPRQYGDMTGVGKSVSA